MLLSIIIPNYNRSEKILATLKSVEYCPENVEILVIDDGSTDNSVDVINDFIRNKLQFKIFQQPNQGVSVARNKGIEEANGEYVYFLDAEDCVVDNFFVEVMTMIKTKKDIYIFGYEQINADGSKNLINSKKIAEYGKRNNNYNAFFDDYLDKLITTHMCSVIFKKQLLIDHDIKFIPKRYFGEDRAFYTKAFYHSQSAKVISKVLFKYIITDNSVTTDQYTERNLTSIYSAEELYDYIISQDEKYTGKMRRYKQDTYYMNYQNFILNSQYNSENAQIKKEILKRRKQYEMSLRDIDLTKKYTIKQYIKGKVMFTIPKTYKKMKRWKAKI